MLSHVCAALTPTGSLNWPCLIPHPLRAPLGCSLKAASPRDGVCFNTRGEPSLWVHTWSSKQAWCFMAPGKTNHPSAQCSVVSPALRIAPHERLGKKSIKKCRNLIKCIDLLWASSQVRVWVLDRKWFWFSKVLDDWPTQTEHQLFRARSQTMVLSMLGFKTDKRLYLICYCCTVCSSLNWFTDVSLSNTGWEPVHTNMLNAAPHIAF